MYSLTKDPPATTNSVDLTPVEQATVTGVLCGITLALVDSYIMELFIMNYCNTIA